MMVRQAHHERNKPLALEPSDLRACPECQPKRPQPEGLPTGSPWAAFDVIRERVQGQSCCLEIM